MKKPWRPKDWDIMNYCSVEEQMESPLLAMHFFEAGADAMLKALRSGLGEYIMVNDVSELQDPDKIFPCKGFLVFIPMEEE